MAWSDLPEWWRRWWRYADQPPPPTPPGPAPGGGPAVPPAEHTSHAVPLAAAGASRPVARAGVTLEALPLHPAATTPITAAVDATALSDTPLRPAAAAALTLEQHIPTTPPIVADAPTFYARGEPDELDLAGRRRVRPHGPAGYTRGVDDGGSAYRGGDGDFHVDTRDGWASTAAVSFEAWVKPVTVTRARQSILDVRSHHYEFGDWLLAGIRWILGILVLTLRGLGDWDLLEEWPRWRGTEAFDAWRAWWSRELLRDRRDRIGWELHLAADGLVAEFGTGDRSDDGAVAVEHAVARGHWTHIAATCDGATRRLYVDGQLAATAVADGYVPPVPGVDLVIARAASSTLVVDEVAVFDYVLSGAQVAAHYAGVGAGATAGVPVALAALPLRPVAERPPMSTDDTATGLALQPLGSFPIGLALARLRAVPLQGVETDFAFAEAIAEDYRRPLYEVRADWDRDGSFAHPLSDLTGLVEELTIDRHLSGDLPAEVGLVEGTAAASMSLRLAGQWDTARDTGVTSPAHPGSVDAVAAFAPYSPDAPLYGYPTIGTDITADLGFLTRVGPVTRRRFTGTVSRVNPSSRERNVALDALDGANGMRAPIFQPPTGMDSRLLAQYGPHRYASRINSQWLVDRIFRANGWYASPPPQDGAFLSVTMHGSAIPEIGSGGMPQQASAATPSNPAAWTNDGHPHAMLYPAPGAPAQTGLWIGDEALTMFPGEGVGCSFWMRAPTRPTWPFLMGLNMDGGPVTGPGSNGAYAVLVTLSAGAPAAILYTPGDGAQGVTVGGWQVPAEPTWHHIGIHWAFSDGTCAITFAVDGATYTPVSFGFDIGPPRIGGAAPTTSVEYELAVPMTNICWWKAAAPPAEWVGPGWVPMADIDPGLNELTGIPQIAGEDSWDLLTELAAAEAGSVGFSETGRPFFTSRAVDREPAPAARLTADRDLADLVTVTDEASVRNSISSATTPLLTGDYEWVVEAKEVDEFEVGPGPTYFTIALPADTTVVDPLLFGQLNGAAWEVFADRADYRYVLMYACVYTRRRGTAVDPNLVSVRVFQKNPAEITLAIFNYSAATIRFQTEDTYSDPDPQTGEVTTTEGTPALRVPGRLLKAAATVPQNIADPGSIALFGQRAYDIGGGSNRWHQHSAAITGVAETILASTAHPAPVLDTVSVPHDPRRRLAGLVTLVDPAGLGEVAGSLVGITSTLSTGAAAVDELTVRPLAPPGFGLLEDEALGGIGTTLRMGA